MPTPQQIAEWIASPQDGRRNWNHIAALLIERAHETGAVKIGKPDEFLLSSGKRSSIYFDGRVLSLDPLGCHLIAAMTLIHAHAHSAEAVGGPAVGGVPVIGAAVALSHSIGRPLAGLFTRPRPKRHGEQKSVEGAPRSGTNVLVIEDTLTTGGSLADAIAAIREAGCQVAGALCIMDRNEGGRQKMEEVNVNLQAIMTMTPEGKIAPVDWQAMMPEETTANAKHAVAQN